MACSPARIEPVPGRKMLSTSTSSPVALGTEGTCSSFFAQPAAAMTHCHARPSTAGCCATPKVSHNAVSCSTRLALVDTLPPSDVAEKDRASRSPGASPVSAQKPLNIPTELAHPRISTPPPTKSRTRERGQTCCCRMSSMTFSHKPARSESIFYNPSPAVMRGNGSFCVDRGECV